ncbi:MAG: hypothetical protein RQ732_05050 [Methylophaga sp.]|nr:hypothetical protein [Methylophaga sp.]
MRAFVKYSGIVALSITMMLGLSACGGSSNKAEEPGVIVTAEGKTLFEAGLQYVKVVKRDVSGIANQHPYPIDEADMRTILSSLYISQKVLFKEEQIPLYSPGELQILSSGLARGLSIAESDEDLTYVTLGVHQGAIAKERKTNTGRVFIDGEGRLNIIFGLVQEQYRDKDQHTGLEIDRRVNPLLPGTRKFDSKPNMRVALDNGQSYYVDPETNEERSDWLVIDIPTVLATARERAGDAVEGMVSPELREDIARNKRDSQILRDDMANIKEILFEMSAEIEALREQLKADQAE